MLDWAFKGTRVVVGLVGDSEYSCWAHRYYRATFSALGAGKRPWSACHPRWNLLTFIRLHDLYVVLLMQPFFVSTFAAPLPDQDCRRPDDFKEWHTSMQRYQY